MSDDEHEVEPLSSEEREALRALPREAAPPPGLEGHVLRELRARGLVRSAAPAWRMAAAAAALVLCFAAGRLSAPIGSGPGVAAPGPAPGESWLLLLHGGQAGGAADAEARFRTLQEWTRETRGSGVTIDGAPLAPEELWLGSGTATPETDSSPTGYFLVEGVDAERARSIARSCPFLDFGGRIELRRIGLP